MRYLVFLALLTAALLPLACSGGGKSGEAKPQNGKYDNTKVGYSFQYPKEWGDQSGAIKPTVRGGDQVDAVVVGNVEPELTLLNGVMVTVYRINHQVAADMLGDELNATDKLFQDFAASVKGRLVSAGTDQTMAGLKARQYIVQFVYMGQVEVASAQTVTYFKDLQYTVNCWGRATDFDQTVLPGCEQILNRFRIK